MPAPLPSAVWRLGWVSLLTDAASEAIYPLLPFFLSRVVGGGALALGVIEGAAEAVNSALRVAAGRLSDRWGARRPLVIAGYALSSAARPLIGLAGHWTHVFAIRLVDRTGKGIRGAPRDALLASYAPAAERGRVFGFHRAMDHAGAVVGPLAASAFLWAWPGRLRELFLLAALPGALAVITVWRIRDVPSPPVSDVSGPLSPPEDAAVPPATVTATHATPAVATWRQLPRPFYTYLAAVTLFTLGNSSDAFLLLRLGDAAGSAALVPLLWSLLHVVKAGLATAGGALSDRVGRVPVLIAGWLVYATVYVGFAASASFAALAAWFLVYGSYFALTEGAEKALVADMAPPHLRGTAFGIFQAVVGAGALVASVTFGLVWTAFGAPAAFLLGAALALAASALLWIAAPRAAVHPPASPQTTAVR